MADYGIDREAIVHLILKEAPKPPPAPAPVVHAKEKGPAAAPVPAVSDLNEAQKAEFLTSFARGSTSNSVEIVFSFDTTGSMSSCLALVRDKVRDPLAHSLND